MAPLKADSGNQSNPDSGGGGSMQDVNIPFDVQVTCTTTAECADADDKMRAGLPPGSWDDVFPPRPSPMCGWCDFRRHCEQGRVAAAQHRPWDGLTDI